MYTRLNGMGWYPRRWSSVIPRAFDTGVDHTTLSTPGVLCPRFSVTRRTANALPLNERVRNLCKAFTLRQFRSFVALAIRICRFRTFPVTLAQSMPCHSIRSAEDADAGLSTRHFLSSNCMLTCCLLEKSQARRRKSPPAGILRFPQGRFIETSTGKLPVETMWKSARFRVRRRSSPYPNHYSPAFAFSTILYPHLQQHLLRSACPRNFAGGNTGLPSSTPATRTG
jgi:hypothetical protein